jgi:hypothetical protein
MRTRRPLKLLLVGIVCCGCEGPYKQLRDDAIAATECDNSRLLLERPSFEDAHVQFKVWAVCWSAPLDTFGPGPGMPPVHATAWAQLACPSHEALNSIRGYFFSRCQVVAKGVGDPPL